MSELCISKDNYNLATFSGVVDNHLCQLHCFLHAKLKLVKF